VVRPDFSLLASGDSGSLSAVATYALVMVFDIGGALFGLCSMCGLVENGDTPGATSTYVVSAASE
jgi:hypothetical protein